MINFIVCEDEKVLRGETKNIIDGLMMNYDIDYKINEFDGYNTKFEEIVKKDMGFKIYLLDIKTKKGSGIDAARIIREQYDDWNSVIILITSYSEYKYEALCSRLFLLDYINKLDNCHKKIKEDLVIAMKHYDNRYNVLSYEYNHTCYKIEYRQMIYIEKEPDSKRCIIKTTEGRQTIPGTLNQIYDKLDNRFLKVHKSMVVNLDHIKKYEIGKNKVTFKNGDHTHLISRNMKKELIHRVSNN
ncbi:MAG: hypothetical protein HFJ12_04530 [Bacilli bacterium]|nr:hypothetical protein [Bacilli bacterium]